MHRNDPMRGFPSKAFNQLSTSELLLQTIQGSIAEELGQSDNIGAFIIRIGFGSRLYYNYYKEPPQNPILTIKAPTLRHPEP